MNTVDAVLAFLSSLLALTTKAIKPDEIRIGSFDISKPRLSSAERIKIYDREFRRLKNHVEIEIGEDISFVNYNLTAEERALLIELLKDRIFEYRKECVRKFPNLFPKFKKWLAEREAKK